ncbi:alanine racemase [Lachnospiraceae bacterium WCA-9-b2]|jgi:alanine racemase|uniref:Alanine racemase n=1 Tax=Sporofaciens musculi TaxID=2681861 RepID=A0A7X3SIV8_9FIRM|nr:alanine racemase [Sporofaciens musculi]MCI9423183.1 alanine racemase [Dorea sp.]MXP75958.1 alanine racemase [Sporofaciens musculi]
MKNYSRVCARIDLDAIEYNMEMMRKNLDEGVKILSVIKSDGYGHGALQVARFLAKKEYIWGYAVAALDEGMILRKGGIEKPILVMGCIFPEQWEEMLLHEIHMTIYDVKTARRVSEFAVKMGKKAYIHVKIDTGMSRLGFLAQEDSIGRIEEISRMPNLVIEGMYTHFARADETDKTDAKSQLAKFMWMKGRLAKLGVTASYYHCSNSAGIIDLREASLSMVRAGIATYGLYPSDEVKKDLVPLRPAMEIISHVVHVKWVEAQTPVSYGGTFVTSRPTRIATIPVGYGDGYPRSLSNKGYVLIHGKKAPILGRVCMDQFMVDVTDIDDVEFGDLVTLVGRNGDAWVTVEMLSSLAKKLRYEFICNFGKRVPREFLRHGKVVEQMDYFA